MTRRIAYLTLHYRDGEEVLYKVGHKNIIGDTVKDISIVGGYQGHGPVIMTYENGDEFHAVDIPYTMRLNVVGKALHSYPTNDGNGTSKGATARRSFTATGPEAVMDEIAEQTTKPTPLWFTGIPKPGACGFGPCVLDGDYIWILEDDK